MLCDSVCFTSADERDELRALVERHLGLEHPTFERPSDEDIKAALADCINVIVAGTTLPTPGRWGETSKAGGNSTRSSRRIRSRRDRSISISRPSNVIAR